MNDFTKKELILLEFALTQEIMNTCPEKHDTHPLRVKLESMIDNYCEHPERTYDRKTGQRICPHCDDYFGDNADEIENRLLGYLNE